jgi:hypothetical protein
MAPAYRESPSSTSPRLAARRHRSASEKTKSPICQRSSSSPIGTTATSAARGYLAAICLAATICY